MIEYVTAYLYPHEGCLPFVAIRRGDKYKFYNLTKSSAWRLVVALRRARGRFWVGDSGWSWEPTF